jgi:predicted enzyme related to lactoylglutathione lyase
MPIKNALASVAVKDLELSVKWYEKLFGRPADSRPMPELAEWKFERGGWLQVYRLAERAGLGSCTLAVGSMEQQMAHMEKVGIGTGTVASGATVNTLVITDPDGNHTAFAEAKDPNIAQ